MAYGQVTPFALGQRGIAETHLAKLDFHDPIENRSAIAGIRSRLVAAERGRRN